LLSDLPAEPIAPFGSIPLIARSVIAVMVSEGLTPGFADIMDPSQTYSSG
jgi:hypothetical protein